MGHTAAVDIADVFGSAGMAAGVSFMLPQVYKSWKTKSVEDISWVMLILLVLNCVAWFSYGYLLASVPLMFTNGIGFVIVSVQVFFKLRYSRRPLV